MTDFETLYGVHPVREALRRGARRCREVLVGRSGKDSAIKEILALARQRGIAVQDVSKDEIARRVPGATHQGIAAEVEELPVLALEEALGSTEIADKTIWLGLDGITDPHNLGAILRNAAAFGVSAILLPERRSAGITPLVQKVACGAAEYVAIVDAGNLNQAIRRLKDSRFWVYGAAMEGKPLADAPIHGPSFLVIGAEGEGIRRRTRELCDELVSIPQAPGGVASLNASCASAVLLYEVSRRLGTFTGGEE